MLGVSSSIRNEDNSFVEIIEVKSQFTRYEQFEESQNVGVTWLRLHGLPIHF